jgi:sialate O-acetylesterase
MGKSKRYTAFFCSGIFLCQKLYEKYHVPIGIINSSVGGTPLEAWTSEDGLKDFASIIAAVQKNKDTAYINSLRRTTGGGFPRQQQQSTLDKGTNGAIPWYDMNYVPNGWKTITVPAFWEDQGVKDLNGVSMVQKRN